nr:mitochondrial glycine transporter isoform X1 [Oryctolagus cuniculus]
MGTPCVCAGVVLRAAGRGDKRSCRWRGRQAGKQQRETDTLGWPAAVSDAPGKPTASGVQGLPLWLHQRDLLHPALPTSGSPENAPADTPALRPWVQTCWDAGCVPEGGSHGEPSGPLERDVPFHREMCPRHGNLLWYFLLPEAVFLAGPSPYCPGVGHPWRGLSLHCGGLHVPHHRDQDTLREREVRLREHLRRPEEHLPQRGAPRPLQRPDSDAPAGRALFRNLPDVLQPDQRRSAPRPVGCSPCSCCKLWLWGDCWYSGLSGDSTCRCYQNSHAALPGEVPVDWPSSDPHFQNLIQSLETKTQKRAGTETLALMQGRGHVIQ